MILPSQQDDELAEEAIKYVKAHQKEIVRHHTAGFIPSSRPISIFMAGSPGAGKTEFSRRLVADALGGDTKHMLRIDPDEVRESLPCYIPGRAQVFQRAVAIAVEKIHDFALENKLNFILDGTLSNLEVATKNIDRSLAKKRPVFILYVYQDPAVAWTFTQQREVVEGRNIPKSVFVEQFFAARRNAQVCKDTYGKEVVLEVITRNIKTNSYQHWFNVDNIDGLIKDDYNKELLLKIL